MGQHNEHRCLTCGKTFYYCRSCTIEQIKHLAEGFCSETCSDIFNILSKNSCKLATAEETLNALKSYDLTGLNGNIQAHIDRLKAEVEPKVEAKPKVELKPKTTFKSKATAETEIKEPENKNFRGQE